MRTLAAAALALALLTPGAGHADPRNPDVHADEVATPAEACAGAADERKCVAELKAQIDRIGKDSAESDASAKEWIVAILLLAAAIWALRWAVNH